MRWRENMCLRMCVHVKERDRVRERGGKRERERECVYDCMCWFLFVLVL